MAPTSVASSQDKKLIVSLVGATVGLSTTNKSSSKDKDSNPISMRKDRQHWKLHYRLDPSTNEKRLYAAVDKKQEANASNSNRSNNINNNHSSEPNHELCEIQAMSSRRANDKSEIFASFLCQSSCSTQVIGNDSKLYTITPVDPLFFLLSQQKVFAFQDDSSRSEEKKSAEDRPKQQWQPLDQILGSADPTLQSCLDSKQMGHLYSTLNLSPDERFYKFCQEKALTWLCKKQKVLQQQCLLLLLQKQEEQRRQTTKNATTKGSAYAAGFRIGPDEDKKRESLVPPQSSPAEATNDKEKVVAQAKEQSIQILCSYLNEQWRQAFLQRIQESRQILETAQQRSAKRRSSQVSAASTSSSQQQQQQQPRQQQDSASASTTTTSESAVGNTDGGVAKKKPKTTAVSAGAQRLKKVNTKGMKKMSAFFKVKK